MYIKRYLSYTLCTLVHLQYSSITPAMVVDPVPVWIATMMQRAWAPLKVVVNSFNPNEWCMISTITTLIQARSSNGAQGARAPPLKVIMNNSFMHKLAHDVASARYYA